MNSRHKFNLVIGLCSQLLIIFLGLIVPRIFLTSYGSDTNGLVNTIGQIFTYIGLLEAGISQAARNALFPKVQKRDYRGISLIASEARRYYRKISYIYALIVIILSFILPFVLKTNIDYWTIVIYILFEGAAFFVTFYFSATWSCILNVYGETAVNNIIVLIGKVSSYIVKICMALCGFNIAAIQIGFFVISLIQVILYWRYMKKKYNWIIYTLDTSKEILKDRNNYVFMELASTVFSSTDMIVLSIFVSTSLASVYSIYNMVFISLQGIINAIYNSISYVLGQSFSKSIENYRSVHDAINSLLLGICTVFMCSSYILITPFIRLYTNGVTDVNYFYSSLPLMFCLVQYLTWSRHVAGNCACLGGYANEMSKASIAEALINVIGSVIFVFCLGITGVLLATVLALPVKVIASNYVSERHVLKRNAWKTVRIYIVNYSIFFVTVVITKFIPKITFLNYFQFFLSGCILVIIYAIITFLLNWCVNRDIYYFIKLKRA